jgi:hypothetical protein
MAILSVSKELNSIIAKKTQKTLCWMQPHLDAFIKNDGHFILISNAAKKLLDNDKFVILKNIGFCGNKSIFEAFIKLFGEFYGVIEHTGIHLDCKYTGCNYRPLELHNDDAIDVNYPRFGFIQPIKKDPNGSNYAWNGIVKIDEVAKYFKTHDKDLLDKLLTHKFPMLSYGISTYGVDKNETILKAPILSLEDGSYNVRFDHSRIQYYYFKKEIEMPTEEKLLIDSFLSVCNKYRKRYLLKRGDILIHDNHKALHDREETTIEIDEDGNINSREIIVSFAR